MRKTFINTLVELAESDRRIVLLTGDLGYTVIEPFAEKFPDRFFNVGVAEQNMVGLATGLAEAGFIPFLYSIATFAVLRPYEFIRNGAILHQFPVRILGIGGGFEYGHAGTTHHALEDVGVMRIQPGITTIVPADYQQARSALLQTWNLPEPIYFRLGKDDVNTIAGLNGNFILGQTQIIGEGTDFLFITMGNIAQEVSQAMEILQGEGISSQVMIVSSFNPSPVEDLVKILPGFEVAIAVEEHYVTGGLGSFVAEVIAEEKLNCRLCRCGIKTQPGGISGNRDYLLSLHGLSVEHLVQSAKIALQKR
ncbi:transketolase family protein [Spirulina sp. 06S082]|uniref:transketolase family protein n=1 Tax=Spirulina sp. 06S082 TaxID=3110248 RepID=UPI002B1EF3B4|nr:transketolase C-terminal domain-containing protein [Spirulina sp. 06S082]MEA5469627.1 transketolase C-terminal domain-containing protein [Spirulina sp. 06S082]